MSTTAHPLALAPARLARLLRMLAIALLLAAAGSDAWAVNVTVTSIQPVASEATLSTAVLQFNRDSTSGALVVYFTFSGAAATTNAVTLPTFTVSSSAVLSLAPYALSGTITIANGDASEQLVITALDNSDITGDLPLVVTVDTDPNGFYTVVNEPTTAQIDIAEGDYQASVAVPAPVAYENTALVGNADDPGAPRRGVLRVAFAPIATFPGTSITPGVTQLYLTGSPSTSPPSGPSPPSGTAITITPPSGSASSAVFTGTTTAAYGTNGQFIVFSPGLNVAIPVGSTVTTAGGFSGIVALVPPAPGATVPPYDKALKVQFGGTATLPSTATGAVDGTGTDQYYVTYKIGGQALGSATNTVNNGMGWNVVAYTVSPHPLAATSVQLGVGQAIATPAQVIIDGVTYTLAAPFSGAPGLLQLTSGLLTAVHDGDPVAVVGSTSYSGNVSLPVRVGATSFTIENGVGTFAPGDVFTLAGEDPETCRYVVQTVTAGPVSGTLTLGFRRYTAGTVGTDGVNNQHSALIPGTSPSPALSTVLNVSDDPPYSKTTNLAASNGIVQLLIPAESQQVDFGINPIDNGLVDARLTVSMSLFDDLNYATATPTAGEVIIAGADSTASISSGGNAVQGATIASSTPGSFVISLSQAFNQNITVPFTITGSGQGVGQPGIDYTITSTSSFTVDNGIYSVVIPANSTTATITVTALPTALLGINGKTVTLTLSPTYDYLLAAASGSLNASATLNLLPAPTAVPQLSVSTLINAQQPATYNTFHTVGQFTISSQVAPLSPLSVQYALGGTAAPGTDYLIPTGYQIISGTGIATIPAGATSVTVAVDPNINPLPPYKSSDIAIITLLPASAYTLASTPTSTASLAIAQGQIQVNEISSETANGTYHAGSSIIIDVTFSAPVTISGSASANPTLALNTGATNALATYIVPTGSPLPTPTTVLRFLYTVGNGDVSTHLDCLSTSALIASAGTIIDANIGNAHNVPFTVSTTLPAPATTGSLFSNSDLVIDGTPAVALDPALHVEPSEVGPTPGSFTVTSSVAQTAPLTINYTLGGSAVVNTDIAPVPGTAGQFVIPANQLSAILTITPLANPVVNPNETVSVTLLPGTGYHLVTTVIPATATTSDILNVAQNAIGVMSVTSSTANGTYTIGAAINVTLTFSAPVAISGTPTLALNSGTGAMASYVSGSGTATLLFSYTVSVGDASTLLDYSTATALSGGTITDNNTTTHLPVQLGLPTPGAAASLAGSSALVIDGSPAIAFNTALDVNPSTLTPANGQFTVTCTPAPSANLTVSYSLGGSAGIGTVISAPANFTTGTATGQLTILAGQASATLAIDPVASQTLTSSATVVMTLASGTGYHLAPSPAVTAATLTVAPNAIDISGVSAQPTSGTFGLGSQITIQVTFTAPVTVTGAPTLTLNTGPTDAVATLAAGSASGSGTATINFTYVVGPNDVSSHLDYLSAVALSGGTFSDTSGSGMAVFTALAAPGTHGSLFSNSDLVINGTLPVVTALGSISPDGTYTYGQSLTLTVTFSLPVNVTGTPELQLATGATPAEAVYAGGTGTTTLTFTYVVGANDTSANLDCTSASALSLNGGAITWDGPGAVAVSLALPSPGAAGSLGANTALVINGTLPTGKPPVGSLTGPDAGTGGGCGLGSGIAGLVAALALSLRALALRRERRMPH